MASVQKKEGMRQYKNGMIPTILGQGGLRSPVTHKQKGQKVIRLPHTRYHIWLASPYLRVTAFPLNSVTVTVRLYGVPFQAPRGRTTAVLMQRRGKESRQQSHVYSITVPRNTVCCLNSVA